MIKITFNNGSVIASRTTAQAELKAIESKHSLHEPEEPNRFTNHYDCPCGESWDDDSPYANNDKCPNCNKECQPTSSTDI